MDLNTCLATTAEVRGLAMYTHLVPAVASLILGWVVFRQAQNRAKAVLFGGFCAVFAYWLAADLILWTANNYYLVAALWAGLDYVNIAFFVLLFCFVFVDLYSGTVPRWLQIILATATAIPLALTVAGRAVVDFDQSVCEMSSEEFLSQYKIVFETLILLATLGLGLYRITTSWGDRRERIRIMLVTGSIVLFMGIFAYAEYIATTTGVYELHLYSLLSLPVFMLVLTILTTNYSTFQIGNASIKVLFYLFLTLASSEFFFVENLPSFIITGLTFVVTASFGLLLFRSFEREAKALREVERLAQDLTVANTHLRELDRQKTEFVSIASHQLRSPLTAMTGYASLLLEGDLGKLTKNARDAVLKIFESGKSMAVAIDDFLNVTRIEQGRLEYNYSEFALHSVVKQAIAEMSIIAERKGLKLSYESNEQAVTLYADEGKVKQIITNLIDNAIKYTPQGGVSVMLQHQKTAGTVSVLISDTGIGLSPEDLNKLFGKFSRAENANHVSVRGTGLGLFIAREMARAHGGTITVTSEGRGKGSTFTLTLPERARSPERMSEAKKGVILQDDNESIALNL